MGKKWQETEFLDYKERQIRRRSRKSQEIQQELQKKESSTAGLKIVGLASVLVVAGLIGYVATQGKPEFLGNKTSLTASEVKGDVKISSPSKPIAPLKQGDEWTEGFTIDQPDSARCTFKPHWKECRVVVVDKSSVEIGKIQVASDAADKFKLTITGKKGMCLVDLRRGSPLVEVRFPQGAVVKSGLGMFKAIFDDTESAVIVRDSRVGVFGPGGGKPVVVSADERLAIRSGESLGKPVSYPTADTSWQ
ncbi:MAG: hypothetical protein HY815_26435 [Candidatus Riflebacteria bacterium]|nr:hypothetical protein [Candidatus Riflebacteria bacterium]